MSQAKAVNPAEADAYSALKGVHITYAIVFIAALVISWMIAILVLPQFLTVDRSGGSVEPPSVSPLIVISLVFPGIAAGTVNYLFTQRMKHPNPLLFAGLGLIPLVRWIGFFGIVGYVPPELRHLEPPPNPPHPLLPMVIASLPLAALISLYIINSEYMGQLFYGPPIGTMIPGLPIPCGWPILAFILLAVVLGNTSLWVGYQRSLVRGGWKALLAVLVVILFVGPACYLSVLGPAAVQVFIMMQGN